MKKESYKMQKFTAGCLALTALLFAVSTGCSIVGLSPDEKHTGQVTVRARNGEGFEFIRPNGEIFEMAFDPQYLGPKINEGDILSDLTYTDQKDHHEFFVKAVLVTEAQAATQTLYAGGGYVCWSNGLCEANKGNTYYLWKDGGYHSKPESTTKTK